MYTHIGDVTEGGSILLQWGSIIITTRTKCGAEWICGADLNCDNLRIYRAYLRIRNYCSVILRLGWGLGLGIWLGLGLVLGLALVLGLLIVVYKLLEKSDKMWINHVIKTDQWRSAPQIHPAPHFVVSPVFHRLRGSAALL